MVAPLRHLFSTWHDSVRSEVFQGAWGAFLDKPLFGWGHDNFLIGHFYNSPGLQLRSNAHNDWLQMLSCGGIIGFGLYLWLSYIVWKECRKDKLLHAIFWGAFIIAKVNPLPIQPVVVLAVLLGIRQAKVLKPVYALICTLFLVPIIGQRVYADNLFSKSMYLRTNARIPEAIGFAPAVMSIAANEINYRVKFFLDYAMIVESAPRDEQLQMLDSMDYLVKTGWGLHPHHPAMFQIDQMNRELQKLRRKK